MNVPYFPTEDVIGVVTSICSFLGFDLAENDINDAYRIKNSRSKIIIAKFNSQEVRDAIIKAKTEKKIIAKDIVDTDKEDIVYINSHVLPYFNRILSYGRNLVREGKIHACWMAASGVCIRINEDGKQITVYSSNHIDDLVHNTVNKTKPQNIRNAKRLMPDHISPAQNQNRAKSSRTRQ